MLIDTHAHVNFKAFAEDAMQTIKRALDEGVWVVNVGTQIDTSRQAVELSEKYNEGVYAVIGLHPVHTYSQHLDEEESSFQSREESFNTLEYQRICQSSKVVGIGECGLDYYRLLDNDDRAPVIEKQKKAFIAQIKLAKELNKALVIHCRPSAGSQDAYGDILEILDEHFLTTPSRPKGETPLLEKEGMVQVKSPPLEGGVPRAAEGGEGRGGLRFEIHSFTGSPQIAQEFLKRGAYVGLNGIITFDKSSNMQKVVEILPLDKIVLETDAPYLTPVPHRGKRNEPAYVKFVAEKVAEIKNLSFDEVASGTSNNAKNLFNI